MNCKDCMHIEVCKYTNNVAPLSDSLIKESNYIEERCPFFKHTITFDRKEGKQ